MIVPEHVQDALSDAGTNAAQVGTDLARRLIDESQARAQGVYIVAPFRTPERALALFD